MGSNLARAATLVAAAFGTTIDAAAREDACDVTGAADSCVPFVLCVEAADGSPPLMGQGRAYGWTQGVLVAEFSNGVACGGEWRLDAGRGGAFYANCENDARLSAQVAARSATTDAALSYGVLLQGETVRRLIGWSGALIESDGGGVRVPPWAQEICGDVRF